MADLNGSWALELLVLNEIGHFKAKQVKIYSFSISFIQIQIFTYNYTPKLFCYTFFYKLSHQPNFHENWCELPRRKYLE